jgi:tol-pal system protein YbgF
LKELETMINTAKSRLAAACFALAATWMPLQAHAGLLDDEEARKAIVELRAKVDAMAKELNARIDTKSDKSAALTLVSDQQSMMNEINKLRGQIEVLNNELVTSQKRQKDYYLDLDARMKKLEPRQMTVDGKEAAVTPAEQRTYETAMAIFKERDFKGAANALGDFVKAYPDSGYAPVAQYWLGNSYLGMGDCKRAITAFETVASTYRDSTKAPDALLGIASCQASGKDKAKAKKTLQDLITIYPDSSAAASAKEQMAAMK